MTTLNATQIGRVAHAAGFRGEQLVTAIAVALGESSGQVEVVNSIGCVGLWQINQPVHVRARPTWTRAWLQVAANNAAAAWALSNRGTSWGPWVVYTSGSYRRFLTAARAGAAAAEKSATTVKPAAPGKPKPERGADGKKQKKEDKADYRPDLDPPKPARPRAVDDPDPRVALGRVFMHGGKLKKNITDRVIDATLSWSTTQVTQLELTIIDEGLDLFREAKFEKGSAMLYREAGLDLELRVSAYAIEPGPAGTGALRVMARSQGVWKLKRRRGPKVMRNASPSQFVEAECKAAGLKAVVQKSSKRRQVKRDVPAKGADRDTSGAERPSSWTTFQRLATELGYYCFEFAGTVYFGKPMWLIARDKTPMQVALPLAGAPAVWASRSIPTINVSDDSELPVEISDVEVERSRFKECRPGGALQLRGLPPFDDLYLMSSVTMPLMGAGGITVAAATPKNPKPQPPAKKVKRSAGAYDDSSTPVSVGGAAPGGVVQAGGKSALAFVNMAITASSASYVYGAEASTSDATPSALDCSELVQWALGRIGVPFVDGSSAQYGASRKISVAQAMATRGALLWKPGHIGISMGNGQSVEARNPSDGVGIFRAADIAWAGGGLVPGLAYG